MSRYLKKRRDKLALNSRERKQLLWLGILMLFTFAVMVYLSVKFARPRY
jgi:hypothetical protein